MPRKFTKPKITGSKKTFRNSSKFNLEALSENLKEKKFLDSITKLNSLLSGEDQADILLTQLNKSKYQAFSHALKQLNYVILDYKKSKNNKIIEAYLATLEKEVIKSDLIYYHFTEMRVNICRALLGNKLDSQNIIDNLAALNLVSSSELKEEQYIDFIVNLAEKIWKEDTKTLRRMYGKV